ncbi:hypothetical protein I302_101638 [Kwoniella bestiolae CBS 10118]|uniref:Ketoreductase domain-containing protein n=1 Tax=Kwoniella bestiolae CBS 10118 TaxID=1296100 RepID=A0A1B9GCT1_9TREE|nr:hypothetical protein I302_00318 [Kwoniella bestiolae CBS 10118]OCF28829.1 hypothetical protein I302_00318 [Kwoniella bestiolae CBS 10118]
MNALADTPSVPVLDLFSLKGQNALITGGSRGIGRAISLALAQAGARVVLAQRDLTNTITRDEIRAAGGQADIIGCDLNDVGDCKTVFDKALELTPEIHILINCGGMLSRCDTVDVTTEDWHYVINVNLNSLFILCQAAGRHMIPLGRGRIINVASLNSFIGGFRVASYSAAKGGVTQLTKALSNEWAKHNITVNAIAPGSIATDINTEARKDPSFVESRLLGTPGNRWGSPDDFRGPAVFLASAASAFITGEVITVDGGAMAKGPI